MNGLEEVGDWFRKLKSEGKIRRFGFSIEGDLIVGLNELAAKGLLVEAVVQTPVSDTLLNLPDEWRHVSFIAHSPFKFLQDQTRDLTAVGDLGELIRKIAGACQCETLVCSMFTHSHLVSNLAVWKESRERRPTK